MDKLSAVLTGDLIGSTDFSPNWVERSMHILGQAASCIEQTTPNHTTRFTRNRGDGWQLHLDHPGDALWVAVYLNASLKADPQSLATRIAIGIGGVQSFGATGLAAASGTAFTHSGRALDGMVAVGQILALSGTATDDLQRSLLAFIADRIKGWSREQAEVMIRYLDARSPTQAEVAAEIGITRQAVGARLQAAGSSLIYQACDAFKDHFDRMGQP